MDTVLLCIKIGYFLKKAYKVSRMLAFALLGLAFIQNWEVSYLFDEHTQRLLLGGLLILQGTRS